MIINKLQTVVSGEIRQNVSLADYTTFKIGGPAKYFYLAANAQEIIKLVKICDQSDLKYFILGGGSNILIADAGFDGLAIKINNSKINIKDGAMECGAGVSLSKAVGEALALGWSGLEWAVGIPGTVGGAVCGNAGAYGNNMSDSVSAVEVLRDGRIGKLSNKDCQFEYRGSIFKKAGAKDIILSVTLKLVKADRQKIKAEMDRIIAIRRDKIGRESSAGSVFRNIELTEREITDFKDKYQNFPDEFVKHKKIPAAWLIDECELKSKKIGGAMVSEKHSGFIVNVGGATASDVVMLISIIKQKVRTKFGLQLMEEIAYVGF